MFINEGGGVKGRLNNVKKTDDMVREGVPYIPHLRINVGLLESVFTATSELLH